MAVLRYFDEVYADSLLDTEAAAASGAKASETRGEEQHQGRDGSSITSVCKDALRQAHPQLQLND